MFRRFSNDFPTFHDFPMFRRAILATAARCSRQELRLTAAAVLPPPVEQRWNKWLKK